MTWHYMYRAHTYMLLEEKGTFVFFPMCLLWGTTRGESPTGVMLEGLLFMSRLRLSFIILLWGTQWRMACPLERVLLPKGLGNWSNWLGLFFCFPTAGVEFQPRVKYIVELLTLKTNRGVCLCASVCVCVCVCVCMCVSVRVSVYMCVVCM